MNPGMMSSNTDLWATPQEFFNLVNDEFRFTLDVCALPENAKCAKFFTPEQDGLKQDWGGAYLLDEPTLRTGDRPLDRQGVKKRGFSGGTFARKDGYSVVS